MEEAKMMLDILKALKPEYMEDTLKVTVIGLIGAMAIQKEKYRQEGLGEPEDAQFLDEFIQEAIRLKLVK